MQSQVVVPFKTETKKAQSSESESQERVWPYSSQYLCWHCCHPFNTIPVFLPVPEPTSSSGYHLSGNFCSWNCVKAYYFYSCQDKRKATSVQVIALLAFLTYHRPRYCNMPTSKHSSVCPCLDVYKGLKMAPRKEVLVKFGGTVPIQTYRKGFMMIEKMSWIQRVFIDPKSIEINMTSITSTPRLRSFTYAFDDAHTNGTKQVEQEEVPDKPVVHKKRIKHQALFG